MGKGLHSDEGALLLWTREIYRKIFVHATLLRTRRYGHGFFCFFVFCYYYFKHEFVTLSHFIEH